MSPATPAAASSPRFRTVLFDLDGTVIDSIALILACYRSTFAAHGLPETPEKEMRRWIGIPLEIPFQRAAPDGWEPMVETYRRHMDAEHDDALTATPGIRDVLGALGSAGVRTGVVTAKRRELAQRGLDVTGLEQLPLLVAKEDTATHKPAPEPLLRALELLGADASDTVYVGDAATDLAAARAAGVAGIGVTWGAGSAADLEAERPIAIVGSAAELAEVLGVDGRHGASGVTG